MSLYPPKIDERFKNPQNVGTVEAADAAGASGSFVCGAALRFSLKIEAGKIVETKFKAVGCGYLIAAAEVLLEMLDGKTIGEAGHLTIELERARQAVENELGEFIAERKHCLELCLEVLRQTIDDYRRARLETWQGEEALICTCFGVSEKTIETAIVKNGLTSVEEVTENCRAGGGCGACQPLILDILEDVCRA